MKIIPTNPEHNYLRRQNNEGNRALDPDKAKGAYHSFFVDYEEVLAWGVFGALIGGWNIENNAKIFNVKGVFYGSLIFGSSAVIGTSYESLLGFAIYHNQGSFVGLIAGSSIKASLGAFSSLIAFKSYKAVLCGAIAGFFVDGVMKIHQDLIYNNHSIFNETDFIGSSAKLINHYLGEYV